MSNLFKPLSKYSIDEKIIMSMREAARDALENTPDVPKVTPAEISRTNATGLISLDVMQGMPTSVLPNGSAPISSKLAIGSEVKELLKAWCREYSRIRRVRFVQTGNAKKKLVPPFERMARIEPIADSQLVCAPNQVPNSIPFQDDWFDTFASGNVGRDESVPFTDRGNRGFIVLKMPGKTLDSPLGYQYQSGHPNMLQFIVDGTTYNIPVSSYTFNPSNPSLSTTVRTFVNKIKESAQVYTKRIGSDLYIRIVSRVAPIDSSQVSYVRWADINSTSPNPEPHPLTVATGLVTWSQKDGAYNTGNEINELEFDDLILRLSEKVREIVENDRVSLIVTYCHASCHSNCHYARGRR